MLFVTCRDRLEKNIGQAETRQVLDVLDKTPSVTLLSLSPSLTTAEQAAAPVRAQLKKAAYAGVVILGGYDVVPAYRMDVLDAATRRGLEAQGLDGKDADDFIVWSDELYGDRDGDYIAELPVTRIADGRRAEVMFAALQATPRASDMRFGVRNYARPFAVQVFPLVKGSAALEVSELLSPDGIPAGAAAGSVYLMLHGSARDGSRFWGETQDGEAFEAVAVQNIPESAPGSIVFTGCCWGALTSAPPAAKAQPEIPLRPRGPEGSMAIAYLKAGAIAFVGCTGSHYSPLVAPYDYFGKPMHEAFWTAIGAGLMPAAALFRAKQEFARRMPHGQTDLFSQAVELKILRQYTCLGLGW